MADKNLSLFFAYVKMSFKTAFEYKLNFFLQVTSMALNNLVWLVFWIVFFVKFPSVEGWNINHIMQLYVICTIGYGLAGFFFGNYRGLSQSISEGGLDFFLALPKNELWHFIISRSSFFDLGDLVFGIILAFFCVTVEQIPLVILFSMTAMLIIIHYGILLGSLSFLLGYAKEMENHLFFGMISFTTYPFGIFKGFTKFILLTLVPAGFVSGIPVQVMNEFSLNWTLGVVSFTAGLMIFTWIFFYYGLKKYESGNLISIRV